MEMIGVKIVPIAYRLATLYIIFLSTTKYCIVAPVNFYTINKPGQYFWTNGRLD